MRGEQLDNLARDLRSREQVTRIAGATLMKREQLFPSDEGRFAWQDAALCLQVDPDLFFPEKGGTAGREAKKICEACAVRQPCREFADSFAEEVPEGIWDGKNDRTRTKLKKDVA